MRLSAITRRVSLQAALVALGLALLGGCGCDSKPAGTTGDAAPVQAERATLRRGNGPEPDTVDPQLARTDGAFNILRDLFEGLTAVSPDGSPVPAAAESWTVSPDGLEYRFMLREVRRSQTRGDQRRDRSA